MNKIILLTLLPLLLSCSTIPTVNNQVIDDIFPNTQTQLPLDDNPTPPAAISDALVPQFDPSFFNSQPQNKATKFNISLHEVEAREFFMGLVIDTNENMMIHPDVSGLISLELKNVTVAQVMDAVQKVYGYDYKKNDIGYIVYPATLQTKIFKINRLDLIREGQSSTRVSSGQLSSQSDSLGLRI